MGTFWPNMYLNSSFSTAEGAFKYYISKGEGLTKIA